MEHPQENGRAVAANKTILSGMKKKLDEAKGLWVESLHKILWSYHTTPYSTTQETPFRMVYGANAMIPVEINTLTGRRIAFDENANSNVLDSYADLLDEIRETIHIRVFVAKQRISRRFNIKVRQRGFQKGDMVFKNVTGSKKKGKLAQNCEGTFRIRHKLNNCAYKL